MKIQAQDQPRNDQTRGVRRIDLASAQPASSEIARGINRDILLELIHRNQLLAQADLSRLSGLRQALFRSSLSNWSRKTGCAKVPVSRH